MVSVGGGKIRFLLQGGPPLETPETFHDDRWHHVATTVGPGGQKLYVDGRRMAAGNLERRTRASNRLGLDGGPGAGPAKVALDELRIFGRALSEGEIEALFRRGGF